MGEIEQYEEQGQEHLRRGDYATARDMLRKALELAKTRERQAPGTNAQLWQSLGQAYHGLGDVVGAHAAYGQALTLHRMTPDPYQPQAAIVLLRIARLYHEQGNAQLAWSYYTEALAVWQRLDSAAHRAELAACLHGMGEIMAESGEHARARRNFEQALQLREAALGGESAAAAECLSSLGLVCAALGDGPAASRYLERALALYAPDLGADHPIVLALREAQRQVAGQG
jgi:tetratricopeptide (TPR) repeat protein